jgi:threonine-phosphate decarboxylase
MRSRQNHHSCSGRKAASRAQGRHGGETIGLAGKLGINPDEIVDFSCNTNIFALDLTRKIVGQSAYAFDHYPDQNCTRLNLSIARHEDQSGAASGGVSAENILAGNGAAELIRLALRVLSPTETLFIGPVFSEYIYAAKALRLRHQIIPTLPEDNFACTGDILRQLEKSTADLAVLCTPNNPGGITYGNMDEILGSIRSPKILLDLSYREFLYGAPAYRQSFRQALNPLKNRQSELLCLHSFTKFFCCPGIRLGYLTGEKKTIAALRRQTPAWSVSQSAQDLGTLFLEHLEEYRATLGGLATARSAFGARLRGLEIFNPGQVLEGVVFFCCGLSANAGSAAQRKNYARAPSAALRGRLLQSGMLIRDCANIPGMPPGFVRIQVRSGEDNEKLLKALETAGSFLIS